ncbi:hypothetical protein M427DRAFT_114212 [Gonapodya prolifera JEL478]|uniref:uS12 prolyl 3,4-dihydroxylase n=1 Tax=Gonapodya prolifera (strain JEL478) TaxID=1344416 RepID=A0A139A6A3_GONPJ|nr:hypothetical protein M427DRAFT_114212 [Gonapodya prolifera JEL478]|eukprot:KXS12350.1 hypothetical protein M427DRAFT_114212 [Gonapodya prolifera JEL478]
MMVTDPATIAATFAPDLLSDATANRYRQLYGSGKPYEHTVVSNIFNEDILKAARKEMLESVQFTEKETDIYKVNQTGDLANLDGLPEEEKAKLATIQRIRDALYSSEFRSWVSKVTGCGPLSAKKRDMSVNVYTQGCHLLNHDDVISTRKVSFILYMPDPEEPWQPEWGGKIELYPVKTKATPDDISTVAHPPLWNHFAMFTVIPGYSFHAVEEVVAPGRSRLSVQGWFHRPQEGEEGYDVEVERIANELDKEMSSLASLSAKQNVKSFDPYPASLDPPLPGSPLTTAEKTFLVNFINPSYLVRTTQAQVSSSFSDDSHVLLADILRKDLAQIVEKALRSADGKDGFCWWEKGKGMEGARILQHAVGTARAQDGDEEHGKWTIAGPPHQQRYCALADKVTPASAAEALSVTIPDPLPQSPSALLHLLSAVLFPSSAFRHLIANLTGLVPISGRPAEARRFRPGLDYTLARSDEDTVLDVTLCLTPDVAKPFLDDPAKKKGLLKGLAAKKRKVDSGSGSAEGGPSGLTKKQAKDLAKRWEAGEVGGWECYMAPHEGEEDPAVYRSAGSSTKASVKSDSKEEVPSTEQSTDASKEGEDEEMYEDVEEDSEDEDDDDDSGALLNLTPSFNTLSIVLRDGGVMRFVKYLSATAGGSRWDVIGEFEVGAVEMEED